MPEEIAMRCEKLTYTELDELGVDLEVRLSKLNEIDANYKINHDRKPC